MIKLIVILFCLAIFASGATYGRYGNFDPCDWTVQDQAKETAVPKMFWEGRLKAKFLMKGITQPSYSDCILAWWGNRAEEAVDKTAEKALEKIKP